MATKLNTPLASFMSSLLDRIDPHRPQDSGPTLSDQNIAGRWLVKRRIELEYDPEKLASYCGIPPEMLLLLETGVATPTTLNANQRVRLAGELYDVRAVAHGRAGRAWTIKLIELACGQPEADLNLVSEVWTELHATKAVEPVSAKQLSELVRWIRPLALSTRILAKLSSSDGLSIKQINNAIGVVNEADLQIGNALQALIEQGLVSFELRGPEVVAYYQLSGIGELVLEALRAGPASTPGIVDGAPT